MRAGSRRAAAGQVCVAAALALGGCAASPQHQQAERAALGAALAGSYDNLAQSADELRAGTPDPHEPLALLIARVPAQLVGDDVFYVRETAADDPRRVFAQRIWVLEADAAGHSVHGVYRFAEPERWRNGADDPSLFSALLSRDLEPLAGCDVGWRRTPDGFRGANDPAACRVAGDAGTTLGFEQVLVLRNGELDFSERQIDARGATLRGRAAESPYRFRRRPAAGH